MGTPEFAVCSLEKLIVKLYNVVAVVTVPDKPAGRGQKLSQSAVKEFALKNNLPVLQPEKLKDEQFLSQLKSFDADLFIIVAFRMLPEIVWKMPKLGTFNLHGSLLPQYRGAAPINHAVINGEKETGVTTFFIEQQIDTGNILFSTKISIGENETTGQVHDRLMVTGADLVLKTVDAIAENKAILVKQENLIGNVELKPAPKIFKEHCKIDWKQNGQTIHNLIRGLSPYPSAWTELVSIEPESQPILFKIFESEFIVTPHQLNIGEIICDGKTILEIAVHDGFIRLKNIQLAGRKILNIDQFLQGFNISKYQLAGI